MKGFWTIFITVFLALSFVSCAPQQEAKKVNRAVYLWSNTYQTSHAERQILEHL